MPGTLRIGNTSWLPCPFRLGVFRFQTDVFIFLYLLLFIFTLIYSILNSKLKERFTKSCKKKKPCTGFPVCHFNFLICPELPIFKTYRNVSIIFR